jgi:hypothetical protein
MIKQLIPLYDPTKAVTITAAAKQLLKAFSKSWSNVLKIDTIINMQKAHYQHFVRIYNRRKQQKASTLIDAGYPSVRINADEYRSAKDWCKANVKPGAVVQLNTRFWFAYENDATLFALIYANGL